MTTDTTNHHPDPAIHDDDRDDPGLRYSCPNWEVRPWTDYPPLPALRALPPEHTRPLCRRRRSGG
jgi:hypothetical protein